MRSMPALVAGNAVILKMAQQTPLVAERYAEAFEDAGCRRASSSFCTRATKTSRRMIADRRDRVRVVHRIGRRRAMPCSRRRARRFIARQSRARRQRSRLCACRMRRSSATIENLVDGAYFNAGQSCCAVERIYVHRDVYRAVRRRLRRADAAVPARQSADAETTLGPMVRTSAARVRARSDAAKPIQQGARCADRCRASSLPTRRARPMSRRRCSSTSITGCG